MFDQTNTLTTGVDSLTGTAGADTFNADNTPTADVTSVADTVDGGEGLDTFNLYSDGAAGALPTMISIETLNVFDQDDAFTLSAVDQSSVTTLNFIRGDGGTFTTGANVTTVGLTNITVGSVAGTDDLIIELAATNTALTLNVDRLTSTAGDTDENIEINGAALKTVTVNATGTASTIDELDVAGATTINLNAGVAFTATSIATTGTATLNLSGAGAVSIGTLDADINTVTSTATGALTVAIGANVDTVLTSGSGNDVITASTTDTIATTDALSVDAGAGTADVLVVVETADIDTAADAARYKNFEIIRTGDSFDMSLFAGITNLQVTTATNETFSKMSAAQAANVNIRGNQTTDVTFEVTGATTVGVLNTLALTISDGAAAVVTITAADISAAGVETISVTATDNFTASALTGLTAMTNLNVTGAGNVSLTSGALALNVNTIIDASKVTGTVIIDIDGSTANGASIIGSETKANTITGSDLADVIKGGVGADTITGGLGIDTVDLGADSVADTVVLNDDTAGNHSVVTNFKVANDIISFDESAFATIDFAGTATVAALDASDYNEIAAGGTLVVDHVNIITTAAGYASYDAAFAAVTASAAGEVIVGFFNSATSKFELYFDADGADNLGEVLIGQFDILGADVATLSSANFAVL